ncbi:hypothetical protein ACEPW2_09185 [Pseudomonas aeruginosa]
MNKANECTCPSGNGSLRHPCPAHPAPVEQAGGDERAAFEAAASKLGIYTCNFERYTEETAAHENRINARVEDPACAGDYRSATLQDCWKVWQEARAALAQPSPVQAEQAEAERPEVVGYRSGTSGGIYADGYGLEKPEPLMTVAQHERIVAFRWERAMDLMGEHVARISEKFKAERDAALARAAELEAKLSDPTAVHQWQFSNAWFDGSEDVVLKASKEGSPIRTLYTAPAQAQHSVPEEFSFEYRHPNGECHTVTVSREQVINEMPDFLFEALCSKFCNCEPVGETNVVECCCDEYAEEFKLIAAAPGKEGV